MTSERQTYVYVQLPGTLNTVRTWREHFRSCGVSAKDTDYIAPAFLPESLFFEKTAGRLSGFGTYAT